MLAGRNDVKPLLHYNKNMRYFAEDDDRINDAYGYRWRKRWHDQLVMVADQLLTSSTTRRAVLAMWDPDVDCWHATYNPGIKALPCNTHIYFAIEDGHLNMTVCNRSNDLIWGALGANAVHFSILQEWMSFATNTFVGWFATMSNNLHVYTENNTWRPEEYLAEDLTPYPSRQHLFYHEPPGPKSAKSFLYQCENFCRSWDQEYDNEWLQYTARPMMRAWECHKARDYQAAIHCASKVWSTDWKNAAIAWLQRTRDKHERKAG